MIRVQITVNIDGVEFSFEKETYSSFVAGGQVSRDIDKALETMRDGYNKIEKALESQK